MTVNTGIKNRKKNRKILKAGVRYFIQSNSCFFAFLAKIIIGGFVMINFGIFYEEIDVF